MTEEGRESEFGGGDRRRKRRRSLEIGGEVLEGDREKTRKEFECGKGQNSSQHFNTGRKKGTRERDRVLDQGKSNLIERGREESRTDCRRGWTRLDWTGLEDWLVVEL